VKKERFVSDDNDMASILRQMRVPERMTGSQALRDFLQIYVDDEDAIANNPERLKQLNGLLILSQLEVINALGAMEEAFMVQQQNYLAEIEKRSRKRRWF
jgi:hypothetical protein